MQTRHPSDVPSREIPVEAARLVEGAPQICHASDVPAREIPVEAGRAGEGVVQTRHARNVPAREIPVEGARIAEGVGQRSNPDRGPDGLSDAKQDLVTCFSVGCPRRLPAGRKTILPISNLSQLPAQPCAASTVGKSRARNRLKRMNGFRGLRFKGQILGKTTICIPEIDNQK